MALKFKLRLLRLSAKLVLTIFHVCVNKLVDDDDDDEGQTYFMSNCEQRGLERRGKIVNSGSGKCSRSYFSNFAFRLVLT